MAAAATESATICARPAADQVTRPATEAAAAGLAAAGLAAASVPLHGWMLAIQSHGVVLTALMAAMALWCLWCAVGVVRGMGGRRSGAFRARCARTRSLRHLWVMAGAMALLHVALLTGLLSGGGHHAAHGTAMSHGMTAEAAATTGAGVGPGAGLTLAIVVLEVAVCFACAAAVRTRYVPRCT
jgi:hypothetical protein